MKEVKALFGEDASLLASIVELKPEVGDNYFIRFDDEEKTMSAWNFIRTKKRNDKPISARIKSESILRNSYASLLNLLTYAVIMSIQLFWLINNNNSNFNNSKKLVTCILILFGIKDKATTPTTGVEVATTTPMETTGAEDVTTL